MHAVRSTLVLALLMAPALAGGCSRRPTPVPVQGRITYGGSDWPRGGRLYFVAEPTAGALTKPGLADFDIDGHFVVTTFQPGDGLLPGEYRVNVECWEVPPSMDSVQRPKSYLPEQFRSGATSGFKILVAADARGPIELNLDVPKP